MKGTAWESNIIIPGVKKSFTVLEPVSVYKKPGAEYEYNVADLKLQRHIDTYVKKDVYPLPVTDDREGYQGDRHYDYWLGGLSDFQKISAEAKKCDITVNKKCRVLDFGCASGRVLRHFAAQSNAQVWGCDISEDHVTWCNKYLGDNVTVFQNTSLPNLQVEDNYFDIVYAMSVFTHIEAFETSWLAELVRILKRGGIAYLTIHDEISWHNMPVKWGVGAAITNHPDFKKKWLKTGFEGEKAVFRWKNDASYSSNVFYKLEYVKRVWGKFFEFRDIIPMGSSYQTVLVLQKR